MLDLELVPVLDLELVPVLDLGRKPSERSPSALGLDSIEAGWVVLPQDFPGLEGEENR